MQCWMTGRGEYNLLRRCILEEGHINGHQYRDSVVDITLQYEQSQYIGTAISNDAVSIVLEWLNEDLDFNVYSGDQVKAAMWKFLDNRIDKLLETIADDFKEHVSTGTHRDAERLLGFPERDLAQERREEAGDIAFDSARDDAMTNRAEKNSGN